MLRVFAPLVSTLAFAMVVAGADQRPPAGDRQVQPSAQEDGVSVYFSPGGGCTEAIVETIRQARKSIDVQAYSFTSAPIGRAVADAHARGVKVRAVLDDSNQTDGTGAV